MVPFQFEGLQGTVSRDIFYSYYTNFVVPLNITYENLIILILKAVFKTTVLLSNY